MVVDEDPREAQRRNVYVKAPPSEALWSIGIYRGPSPLELSPADVPRPASGCPVLSAESVTDVAAVFVADPFLLRHAGRWHMFFEVMNWKANKGEIALATSDDGLRWQYEQIVLAEAFHLSYPHVLAAEDGTYMVPESFQDESVRLYRAKRFPYEWEFAGKLLSGGYYADSSPLWHDGSWWLFTETGRGTNDTLRLFYADRLAGPWHEHPKSPVVAGDAPVVAARRQNPGRPRENSSFRPELRAGIRHGCEGYRGHATLAERLPGACCFRCADPGADRRRLEFPRDAPP